MTVTLITTHEVDALARLLEQYKTAPHLQAILTKLSARIQSAETMLSTVRLARSIAGATDEQLDEIGAIVGVTRPDNAPDYVYRVIIYGKASANTSDGTTERVIDTYRLLTSAQNVRLDEAFPAKINIFSDGALDSSTQPYIKKYLKLALPAGVQLGTFGHFSQIGFGFAENPSALGFGNLNDPAVGGGLGSILD